MKNNIKKLFGKEYAAMRGIDRARGWYFVISITLTAGLVDAPIWGLLVIAANMAVACWQVSKVKMPESKSNEI